jgi:hypothetical protein
MMIYPFCLRHLPQRGRKSSKYLLDFISSLWGECKGGLCISKNNKIKTSSIHFLIVVILFTSVSCHHNRLKTNEKELTKEIRIQEKEKREAEQIALDTLAYLHTGFKYKEDRSVDPSNPPVLIDIAGSINNIKEFKLSDIASEVQYIRLETVPDSTFPRVMKFKYYLFPNHIIATNPGGILLYTKDGKYINTVVKNKTTGITLSANMMLVSGENTFIGGGVSVWRADDSLFYSYRNSITGQAFIMKHDLSKNPIGFSQSDDPENQDQITGMGEIAIDMNPEKKSPVWKYKIAPELVMWGMSSEFIYQAPGTFLLDRDTYATELQGTNNLAIVNKQGDSLTTFTGFHNGGTLRIENEGKQLLWSNINDTIFQIIPPNRIVPVYVLNMGQYKAERIKGADNYSPDYTGKILPLGWAENKKFIFLSFSKDAYDSPDSRKNKKVKIYHALYSKQVRQLYVIKGDPLNYSPEILENDLDGGVPAWPLSYMFGNNEELLIPLKGKELKDRVNSEYFKLSGAPVTMKKKLEKLAGLVSDNEDILMIIK